VRNIRITGRVYIASPIATFCTPRYDMELQRVRDLLPDADLIPARGAFTNNRDWRARWPALLRTLEAVVFFDDDEGCIGAGTEQEITDAWRAGIPVFFLPRSPVNRLLPCDEGGKVEFWPVVNGGMRQTLRVACALSATDVLSMMKGAQANGGA
jgi:hypothetical protein